jgi:hypothetical protein
MAETPDEVKPGTPMLASFMRRRLSRWWFLPRQACGGGGRLWNYFRFMGGERRNDSVTVPGAKLLALAVVACSEWVGSRF